jgi:hypothetical protein
MRQLLLPQADPEIPYERWVQFADGALGWALLLFCVGAFTVVLAYAVHARRLRVRRPSDVFRPYAPLRWLWLALVPGAASGLLMASEYVAQFPGAASPLPAALRIGAAVSLATLLVSYGVACLPGVTPARFRYRPFGALLPGGRAREVA